MRIGVMIGAERSCRLDELVARARDLETRGFASVWIPHVFGLDAVTAAAVVGRETGRIGRPLLSSAVDALPGRASLARRYSTETWGHAGGHPSPRGRTPGQARLLAAPP
jgi:alkanesulfonate monooxygenase SsuD/methylene tetrahydromethanopterin reductase-like flavin-dependent oxidoreductase (luciferase family)